MARWPFVSLGRYSRQPISCFLRWQSSHRRRYSGRYGSHQKNREILDPIFSIQVRAYSSRILASSVPQLWTLFPTSAAEFVFTQEMREKLRTYSYAFLSCYNASTPCFCTTLCQLTCQTYDHLKFWFQLFFVFNPLVLAPGFLHKRASCCPKIAHKFIAIDTT